MGSSIGDHLRGPIAEHVIQQQQGFVRPTPFRGVALCQTFPDLVHDNRKVRARRNQTREEMSVQEGERKGGGGGATYKR